MTFEEWADEQFGKEPHPKQSLKDLCDDADSIRRQLATAEQKIRERQWWIASLTAAMYAWNIKDKDKGRGGEGRTNE